MPISRPVRPSLSPVLWCGLAAWAGSLAGTEAAWRASGGSPWWLAGAWVATATCVFGAARVRRPRAAAALCAALAVGLSTALLHGTWLTSVSERLDSVGPRQWDGTVAGDARPQMRGVRVLVRLDLPGSPRVSLSWPEGVRAPAYGRRVRVWSRLARPAADSPRARGAFTDGEAGAGRPWRVEVGEWAPGPLGAVCRWRSACLAALRRERGPGGAVLAACLFGDRGTLEGSETEEAFRATGVAYLVGGSGLHLGLAVALALLLARVAGAGPGARAATAISAAAVFAAACAWRVSIMRAGVAVVLTAAGRVVGRRRDGSAALGAACGLLVALDPSAAFDTGLLVGVAAVLGLLALGPLAGEWLAALAPRRARAWLRPAGAAFGAQAGLVPVSSIVFGCVSPGAPVAACVVPLVQAPVIAGLMGAGIAAVHPAAGAELLRASARALHPALSAVDALARLPGVSVPVDVPTAAGIAAWAAACTVLWWRWPAPRRVARVRMGAAVLAILTAVAVIAPVGGAPAVVVLDVGQGDAILVRDGVRTMLVDCGPDAVSMRRALARWRVKRIDTLVITHDHEDHNGGMEALNGLGGVRWVGGPAQGGTGGSPRGGSGRGTALSAGTSWKVGSWSVGVAWPPLDPKGLEGNDTSVILLVERAGARVLLLGDAEQAAQSGVLEALPGRMDAVKVAHHGSDNGVTEASLAEWRPAHAVISVGSGNRFGHPRRAALAMLEGAGALVWRTDLDGDVSLEATASGLRVRTSRRRPASVACATIDGPRTAFATLPAPTPWRTPDRGSRGPLRPQARLPDPRRGGAAPRARGPPPAGASGG